MRTRDAHTYTTYITRLASSNIIPSRETEPSPPHASSQSRRRASRGAAMATRSSEAPLVLASERTQSGRWAGGRRALWVVGAFGLIAVLVFQYANELADLNAYGRKYLTKGRTPPRVRLFEREPRDVVVKEELVAKPPAAARDEPRRAPPPPAEVPSPRDAGAADPGKPPAPSLEEYGWVAWPPRTLPPPGRSGVSQSDAGTSASVESSPPPASGGPKASTEGASPNPVRARFRGTTGGTRRWDGRRGVPSSRTRRRKIPLRRKRRENPETKTRRETRRGNGERLRIGTDGSPGLPRTRRRRRRETRTSVLRRRSDAGVGRQKRKHVIDELAS